MLASEISVTILEGVTASCALQSQAARVQLMDMRSAILFMIFLLLGAFRVAFSGQAVPSTTKRKASSGSGAEIPVRSNVRPRRVPGKNQALGKKTMLRTGMSALLD